MHLAAAPRRKLTCSSVRRVRPTRLSNALDQVVRKKLVTSTFTYDNNGNLIQKTVDGTSTTYVWDYANRLTALGVTGAGTTTYGYDAFGARVYQIASTTATTTYPFKFFSVASSTRSGTNYSTSTEYVFNGDTLLATVDQAFRNGAATGTAQTRYIHPDHLGSTNVVTNASGTVVQTLDYYPYGSTRISTNVGAADSARKFIGQFTDQSNLDYLNARYYESTRGQFISQDPVFWEIGLTQDGKLALTNPQALNSYGYANDNPISNKDPNGRCGEPITAAICAAAGALFMPQVAGDPVINADGTVSATPQQARLEASLFIGGFAIPGGGAKNAARYSPEVIAQVERILGPQYAKMLAQGGERAALVGRAANDDVKKLVNELYRAKDQVPGGTAGAAIYQKLAGQYVGNRDHFVKVGQSLNRIGNIISSIGNNLSAGDRQALSYIGGQLQKAQEMIKSIKLGN
jgi:RHS repeat-associated protein